MEKNIGTQMHTREHLTKIEQRISMGESSTVVSAYTMYRHLPQYCFYPLICFPNSCTVTEKKLTTYTTMTITNGTVSAITFPTELSEIFQDVTGQAYTTQIHFTDYS